MEKNQKFEDSHSMVPKKMLESKASDERSKSEFNKCLAILGLDKTQLLDCFTILSKYESEKFEMMQQIPGGFEVWVTISMFIKDKRRVDGMYRRMILRNSSCRVRSSLDHECEMSEVSEAIKRIDERLKGGKYTPLPFALAPLSPSVLMDKRLNKTRKNLFHAFRAGYYDSEQGEVNPSMAMVISNWRGCLEAYRVTLRLDGKHTYPKAIQHGDIFLKIMWEECQPKRRGRKAR